jgi:hypothetical protein
MQASRQGADRYLIEKMERETGFEPATASLGNQHSYQCLAQTLTPVSLNCAAVNREHRRNRIVATRNL